METKGAYSMETKGAYSLTGNFQEKYLKKLTVPELKVVLQKYGITPENKRRKDELINDILEADLKAEWRKAEAKAVALLGEVAPRSTENAAKPPAPCSPKRSTENAAKPPARASKRRRSTVNKSDTFSTEEKNHPHFEHMVDALEEEVPDGENAATKKRRMSAIKIEQMPESSTYSANEQGTSDNEDAEEVPDGEDEHKDYNGT